MPLILDTTKKILNYIEGMSFFVDGVKITEVYAHGFSFKVKVPRWYKFSFGWFLKRKIRKKVGERLVKGVDFDFTLYSDDWF